jgi:diguanylate cyclase (GGDEF)-like protein
MKPGRPAGEAGSAIWAGAEQDFLAAAAASHASLHDPLTGLPGGALFQDRLAHALTRQHQEGPSIAVLVIEVDDPEALAGQLGPGGGDLAIMEIATRLGWALRPEDASSRIGGHQFAVLIEDGPNDISGADLAERILAAMDVPIRVDGEEVAIRVTIGIAVSEPDGSGGSATELLRSAHAAASMARTGLDGRYRMFEPTLHSNALRHLESRAELWGALEREELLLEYQPVMVLATQTVSGVEALVRWRHPHRGLVPPSDFIPLAEETGLIVPMGAWILREACRMGRGLQPAEPGGAPVSVCVNLSGRQLEESAAVTDIADALKETGLDPSDLILEITESVLMRDPDAVLGKLEDLKAIGVRIAIDDFGTGYSSLSCLGRFPVDIVKVDRSFVQRLGAGGPEATLTAAIVELAATLELTPVAEGIEDEDQLQRLLALRCEQGQGFLFARPMGADQIAAYVDAHRALGDAPQAASA